MKAKSLTKAMQTNKNNLAKNEIDQVSNSKVRQNVLKCKVIQKLAVDACVSIAISQNSLRDKNEDLTISVLSTNKQVIEENNFNTLEAMLLNQALTLNASFNQCLRKASQAEFINQMEAYGNLAMKAQKACRATVATLAELKNPRNTTFIRQMNNAEVQQVNNIEMQK